MSPVGNNTPSASVDDNEEEQEFDAVNTSGDALLHSIGSEDDSDDSDDDTSDPIVVSPSNSLPSGVIRIPSAVSSEEDVFEDAKVCHGSASSPSFVSVGLRKKETAWALQSWAALALTLDGRDKITKVLQYSARLLSWWLASSRPHQSQRFTLLYKSLANSRKAFRLGRSLIELEKLRNMGLIGLLAWHVEHSLHNDDDGTSLPPRTFLRRMSSNIGWGSSTLPDDEAASEKSSVTPRVSLGDGLYRNMYRPLMKRLSSTFAPTETPSVELWKALGLALKGLGLLGFWMGDNVNFLTSSGALDDYSLPDKERVSRRKHLQTLALHRACQAYFVGALSGLFVNGYAYYVFKRDKLLKAETEVREYGGGNSLDDQDPSLALLTKLKEKQFSLFLALLKSCCDVAVFSNQPGVDLHQKYRGRKNNEGLHCILGLISASTVIYNNFPDAKG